MAVDEDHNAIGLVELPRRSVPVQPGCDFLYKPTRPEQEFKPTRCGRRTDGGQYCDAHSSECVECGDEIPAGPTEEKEKVCHECWLEERE